MVDSHCPVGSLPPELADRVCVELKTPPEPTDITLAVVVDDQGEFGGLVVAGTVIDTHPGQVIPCCGVELKAFSYTSILKSVFTKHEGRMQL